MDHNSGIKAKGIIFKLINILNKKILHYIFLVDLQ